MKIKFLVPQLSQPRCIKRIQALQNAGYDAEVYGFDNGLYSDNIKDLRVAIHSFKIDKNLSRKESVKAKLACVRQLCKSLEKDDIVYIFGIELALIYQVFHKRNKVIYEQADLNYTKLAKKWLVSIFKALDKWLIAKSSITVLTSQGFIDYLYGENANVDNKIILLPNKLHKDLLRFPKITSKDKNINLDKIRFGFVGAIRYPRTLFCFAKTVAEKFTQHEFHFYGTGICSKEAEDLSKRYSNIFYHGAFRNPIDLQSVYSNIDINIVCYDPASLNVRIAEPNKLYESIYFNLPIVVSKGTFLEKRVKEFKVGFSIDCTDENCICRFIEGLNKSELDCIKKEMELVDSSLLIDDENILVSRVKQLLK